jgi:4-amino-4-deoxy-L-arabinose transferase-like glycosyltransferase
LKSFPVLSRPVAYALLIGFWAAVFLPGLGSIEIKGEEIRRIMPGVNMLQSGNWIVPVFNGQPYLRKPPLVNWAIALSIKSFGLRNEFTVRFPSALAMLAMGIAMLAACAPWLGANTALAAVLITLTSAGIMEKGRLIEIEAIYIALFGMAFACWLGWTATGRSPWLIWPVTGLLLGLGLLAKGPPHLAFFYAIAGSLAWHTARRKAPPVESTLASWAHLCGIAIMLGVFALWCVPYMRQSATSGAGGVWAHQMEERIGGGSRVTVFTNFLRSLVNFLPWALALPLFWRPATLAWLNDRDRLLVVAARWPIVICAFGLMFIPGMLPRYTLPLVIPYALLLALLLKAELENASLRWPLGVAMFAAVGMLAYRAFLAPRIAAHGLARDFSTKINSLMPPGSPICIFKPSIQPELFYIHGQFLFQDSINALPKDVPFLLAPKKSIDPLRKKFPQSQILAQRTEAPAYALLSLHRKPTPPPVAP